MACDCPSLTERCPHCGRIGGQDHKDRCHEAAVGGADVDAWSAAEARRMGVVPPPGRFDGATDERENRPRVPRYPVTGRRMNPGDVVEVT